MSVLCLSPHLDDAALSLGAALHGLAAGEAVTVATVFSAAAGEAAPRWAARREEDQAALLHLRCRAAHLGLLDAPFRRAYFDSFYAICFGADAAEAEDRAAVRAALRPLLRELRPRLVLCPLGVGRHVDHRHVCAAARALLADEPGPDLAFYEDRPYAFVPGAVPARLAELGGDGLAWARGALPFLSRYLVDEDDRARCAAALRTHLGAAPAPGAFSAQVLRPAPADLAARAAALRCYRSQLPDLFGEEGAEPIYQRLAQEEILWRQGPAIVEG